MNETQQPDRGWEPCPSGELGGLVRRLNAESQSAARAWAAGTGIVAVLLAVVALGIFLMRGLPGMQPDFGGLNCAEVQTMMQAYIAGEVDPEVAAQIETHLEHCRQCAELYRKMTQPKARFGPMKSRPSAVARTVTHPVTCHCSRCRLRPTPRHLASTIPPSHSNPLLASLTR